LLDPSGRVPVAMGPVSVGHVIKTWLVWKVEKGCGGAEFDGLITVIMS
jgi:hypothetical protein